MSHGGHEHGEHMWLYGRRIVCRGDSVKGETGHMAVFIKQSTYASYVAGMKYFDLIAQFLIAQMKMLIPNQR